MKKKHDLRKMSYVPTFMEITFVFASEMLLDSKKINIHILENEYN